MSEVRAGAVSLGEKDEWATLAGSCPGQAAGGSCTLPNRKGPGAVPQAGRGVPVELIDHPRYRVVGQVGAGGMGAVFKAEHRVMKRAVALKVIAPHLLAAPAAVERFRREVEAAASLGHPNVVTAYDAEQAGDCHFLVMEFVEGVDLAKYVQKKGPLPAAHACHFIRQAALGLQHAHERGMVHRDVKPHNLMLTAAGVVKVMDFGLALLARQRVNADGLTGENMVMGTADYLAPEQARDAHSADVRADVYSLGCALYHLLAGRPPFAGGSVAEKILAHATLVAPLADLPAGTPDGVRAVLGRMLEKDPARRFQTPGEVARALRPARKAADATDVSPKAPRGATPPPSGADEPAPVDLEPLDPSSETPRPPAVRRRRKPARRPPRWPAVVAAGFALTGVITAAVALWATGLLAPRAPRGQAGDGEVVVFCPDGRLELAVRRGGKVVRTIRPNTPPQDFPPGDYELEVVGGAPELRGFTGKLSLGQGKRMVVDVRLEGLLVQDAASFRPPPGGPNGPPPPR